VTRKDLASGAVVGVVAGLTVACISSTLGEALFWPSAVVGVVVIALWTWNPGRRR
jgi:uncharacterized membrane protein YdbT with pleckstrin-like domain